MKDHPPEKLQTGTPEENPAGEDLQDLIDLRGQIDAIDGKMVSLLAERQAVVDRVVELKKARNLAVYHPAREENLISLRRQQGAALGLDPDTLEELFRCILKQSRVKQTRHMALKGVRCDAKVLIVGGAGSMGRYFFRWFSDAGYPVRSMGRSDWPRVKTMCRSVALVILSVPIDKTVEIVGQIAPHLSSKCILADITSIKSAPLNAMLIAHPGPVVGLHPLFGPSTTTLDKQIIVMTPGRDQAACQWLIDQLTAWGSIIIQTTAPEHDEIMGYVQSLRHFATFAFGQFLYRKKIDLLRTLEFSSPIYRLELGMVGRLFAQEPSLYADIIFASAERRALLKEYLASFNDNYEMLASGDKEKFCAEFNKIAKWFGPFGEQAMRESTYLIDKLIERF
ncbi:MAG: bifunctional chorismate mutase/prephenate dehydrogenase [Desulfobacterales bacterium]|nr:bifunctional chorismate mutase/prephenate dehydrogenase [Desulfobacterales bacterium]